LRESYSDNIRLAPPGQTSGEFTTEVAPGLSLFTNGPRLKLTLDYSLQKIIYSKEADRINQQLNASGRAEVLPDWLYLDARSSISQQNISAFGSQFNDNTLRNDNRDTVRARSISPYLKHYFRGLASAELRYSYDHVASGKLLSVRSDDANLRLTGDNGGRGWNWDLQVDRKEIDDRSLAPVTMNDASLTLSYPLNSRLGLFTTGGYEMNDYHAVGSQPKGRYWAVGARWTPSVRTNVSASVGRRYFGNTYSLDAQYRMHSMFWTLNYNEDITTTHGQFLSVPPTGLSDFLNQLWTTRIPDPQQRLQTIQLFMLVSQLLGPDGNVNFFSHRYYLQKRWNLATVYSGSRSALSFSLSTLGRTAQTSSAIDSPLLGADELALEDRTCQKTAQLGWSWRMSPRGNLNVGASYGVVDSLSTGRQDKNAGLTVGLSHQLHPKASLNVDLRHLRHSSNRGGDYRENGVGVALTVLF
jgi:uncharacterized protein (PEP-CTERM system associated)